MQRQLIARIEIAHYAEIPALVKVPFLSGITIFVGYRLAVRAEIGFLRHITRQVVRPSHSGKSLGAADGPHVHSEIRHFDEITAVIEHAPKHGMTVLRQCWLTIETKCSQLDGITARIVHDLHS